MKNDKPPSINGRILLRASLVLILGPAGITLSFAQISDLIISEYAEGTVGSSKYIEIYNGTGSTVTLSDYRLCLVSNGGTWCESTYTFTTATLNDGATIVVANNATDVPSADEYSGTISWNGNDAVSLQKNTGSWVLLDVVGTDGADPTTGWDVAGVTNATANKLLTRKAGVCAPNTDWDASRGIDASSSEWVVTAYSTGSASGGHTTTCTGNDANSEASAPGSQIAAGSISSLDDTDPEAIDVFKFDIDDLGTSDGLSTKVTNIRIKPHSTNTADWTDHIQGVKLNNGSPVTTGAPVIADTYIDIPVTSGNFDVADAASSTVTMSVYLNTANIVDGAILSFMIDIDDNGFTADVSGSTFNAIFSGGDFNSNDFTVTVAASKLLFIQQPSNTNINTTMAPAVTVEATDANGNRDLDYSSSIRVTSSGILSGTPVDVAAVSGLATFSTLTHTTAGAGLTLNAEQAATLDWDVTSGSFNITDACGAEAFDGGTTEPGGWTFTAIGGTYTSAGNFGAASPSLQLDATNDRVETAAVTNPSELSFWIKGQATDAASALLVEGYNAGWSTIENITASIPTTGTTYTYNSGTTPTLAAGFTKFRFTYTKGAGNLSFDDVSVTCCPDPMSQAANLVFSNLAGCSMTIGWSAGNGEGRIVIMNTANSFTDPVDGTDPAAVTTYGGGEQVIYNGSGNSVNIDGLTVSTTYWFRVYEYTCSGTNINFLTPTGTNNPLSSSSNSCSDPGTQSSALTFTSVTNTSMHVNWTNGDGVYRIVVCKQGSAPTGLPTDLSTYSADQTFNNGQSILNAGEYIVYSGAGDNFTLLGLAASTSYYLAVFEYNCKSGCEQYLTTAPLTGSQATIGTTNPAVLKLGDLAVLALCSNTETCLGSSSGDDELSFVCFVDITEGTALEITDNGWERLNTGQWGNTEGIIQATRTGSTIPAGTVITFRFSQNGSGTYTAFSPDADWTIVENQGAGGTDMIMNAGGDQLFIMQGGTWNYGTAPNHDATITNPNILFGFNSNNVWSADGTTQHSNPYPGLSCFSMMPDAGASDYLKYTGDVSRASQRTWLDRISTSANWSAYANCTEYYAATPQYHNGFSIEVDNEGFTEGEWTGSRNTDWFNCGNWENMSVPDATVSVVFPTGTVDNECTIGAPPAGFTEASCNDLTISTGRTLTIDDGSSLLHVYGNFLNNATLSHSNGMVTFKGTPAQSLGGSSPGTFFQLKIDNSSATGVTLAAPVTVNAVLTLSDGILYTDATDILTLTDGATASSGSAPSFVDGPMKKIGDEAFIFPTGNGSRWARIAISAPLNVTTEYTAQYFATGYGDYTLDGNPALNNVSQLEYWTLEQAVNPGDNVQVTLYWEDNAVSGINQCNGTDLRVVHWDAGNSWWEMNVDGSNVGGGCPTSGWVQSSAVQTEFSPFTFGSKSGAVNPLPVNLVSFTAEYIVSDHAVNLDWVTASESNNDYFTVEKLAEADDFVPVLTVAGAGTSGQTQYYHEVDRNPFPGVSYYRLTQTDYDGQFMYSDLVAVRVLQELALNIWPNPACNRLEITLGVLSGKDEWTAQGEYDAQLNIFNAKGQVVYHKKPDGNERVLTIDIAAFEKGLYLASLTMPDGRPAGVISRIYTARFVKE